MRLAVRIISVSLVSIMLLSLSAGYFVVRNVQWEFELQQRESAERISRALSILLVDQYRAAGRAGISRLLRQGGPASSLGLDVRWVGIEETLPWQRQVTSPISSSSTISVGQLGERNLHTYVPFTVDDQFIGGLEFIGSLEPLERQTQRIVWISLLSMAAFSIASVLVAYFLGIRWIGQPLQSLMDKADQIGKGEFNNPLHLARHDELGLLAQSFNQMCERLSLQRDKLAQESTARVAAIDQLRHADRLKTVGQLAAGIAHEIGTPLQVISGRASLIGSGKLDQPQIVESAATIKSEVDHISGIIRQLLAFARQSPPQLTRQNLAEIVQETVRLLEPLAERNRVRFDIRLAERPIWLAADRSQLQQVLTNILMNSIQAMPDGGVVALEYLEVLDTTGTDGTKMAGDHSLSTDTISADSKGTDSRGTDSRGIDSRGTDSIGDYWPSNGSSFVGLKITDTGCGMNDEILKQVFDPFFTTKDIGEGTGLGLSIALGIVQEHGGSIQVTSQPNMGTQFIIRLPAVSD